VDIVAEAVRVTYEGEEALTHSVSRPFSANSRFVLCSREEAAGILDWALDRWCPHPAGLFA
jgi:hypothetical protein